MEYQGLPIQGSLHRTNAVASVENRIPAMRTLDTLNTIFAAQRRLMEKYHDIEAANGAVVIEPDEFGNLDDRQVQIRLKDLLFRVVVEIGECSEEMQNKTWRQSDTPTDGEAFELEVSDILHFFVEFCITAGLDADRLFTIYFKKYSENQSRQNRGY